MRGSAWERLEVHEQMVRRARSSMISPLPDWPSPLSEMTLIGLEGFFSSRGVAVSCPRVAVHSARQQGCCSLNHEVGGYCPLTPLTNGSSSTTILDQLYEYECEYTVYDYERSWRPGGASPSYQGRAYPRTFSGAFTDNSRSGGITRDMRQPQLRYRFHNQPVC